jgi:hypothetical protein
MYLRNLKAVEDRLSSYKYRTEQAKEVFLKDILLDFSTE